jgi:pyruvate kinase
MLFADGTISIEVMEILTPTTLRGKVLNSKKLGERKNGNLPGVKVDIPVLTEKDIDDLQNFCCKNKMDYVAASFVQSAEDVQFIRRILNEAGGYQVKIISKIENEAGLQNFDEILKYTDGVMVARGDLGMEIPSEKVALAQKMIITKCNIAGKFVICATQMLESMIENPLPTRAEMTDVANAVFDGADAVMLSGETANGSFPAEAVQTMAAITKNSEEGVNHLQRVTFIRDFTAKPVSLTESVLCNAVETAQDILAGLIVVITEDGSAAQKASKYRPSVPVLVITESEQVTLLQEWHIVGTRERRLLQKHACEACITKMAQCRHASAASVTEMAPFGFLLRVRHPCEQGVSCLYSSYIVQLGRRPTGVQPKHVTHQEHHPY